MKTVLILSLLTSLSAFAVQKSPAPDLRQGTKAVDEKYLKIFTGADTTQRNPVNRAQQMEAKKSRQFQEERPR